MAEFFNQFESLLKTAFTGGIDAQTLSFRRLQQKNLSRKEVKRFYAGCHRGYDKAQNKIVEMLAGLESDTSLAEEEKLYRESLLRKIMDGIAATCLGDRIHLMRRLVIHTDAPHINLKVVRETLLAANKLNEESRMTFAVVADLTSFIHIADILRIDFRDGPPKISFTELKTGKVNKILLDKLEEYEPKPEDLARLRRDETIDPRHVKQVERMLRQQIRLAQVDQIMRTDVGADLQLNKKVLWSREETKLPSYAEFLDRMCSAAVGKGVAAGTLAHCLHFGVGYAEGEADSKRNARRGVNCAIHYSRASQPDGMAKIIEETAEFVPSNQMFTFTDNYRSNLAATAVRPFVHWELKKEHIHALARRKLVILMAFDLGGFIWLCRHVIGMDTEFGTRREAAELAAEFGANTMVTWGGRALSVRTRNGSSTLFGGILSRFANDLSNPIAFLNGVMNSQFPRPSQD